MGIIVRPGSRAGRVMPKRPDLLLAAALLATLFGPGGTASAAPSLDPDGGPPLEEIEDGEPIPDDGDFDEPFEFPEDDAPGAAPTAKPTRKPTTAPTKAPTKKPTARPTSGPTARPTFTPRPAPRPTRTPRPAATATPGAVATPGIDDDETIGSPADLTVGRVQWRPARPAVGDRVRFSAVVLNVGDGPSADGVPHTVRFYVDGALATTATYFTGPLEAGESITLTADSGPAGRAWRAKEGRHSVEARIDEEGVVDEEDDSNNRLKRKFTIGGDTASMVFRPVKRR